jgi:hypothetical protein
MRRHETTARIWLLVLAVVLPLMGAVWLFDWLR